MHAGVGSLVVIWNSSGSHKKNFISSHDLSLYNLLDSIDVAFFRFKYEYGLLGFDIDGDSTNLVRVQLEIIIYLIT